MPTHHYWVIRYETEDYKLNLIQLLNVEEHEATLRSGKTVKFEKCLIATGGTPFSRFPGEFEFGRHVSTFRNVLEFHPRIICINVLKFKAADQ
jgi:hypothetical protein